jgi:hypothetical protein
VRVDLRWAAIGLLVSALGGCGEQEISCANGQPIAKQIAISKMPAEIMPELDFKVDIVDVRTTNETKFVAECAANLMLSGRPKNSAVAMREVPKQPLTYRVERMEDGKLYVTVFGL